MDDKSSGKKQHYVYQIIEKPGRERAVWMKLGIAFVNQDQSINVYLDAIPYERKLQIREEDVRPRQASNDAHAPATAPGAFDIGRSIQ